LSLSILPHLAIMTSSQNNQDEINRREQELADRERALRLRELEAELYQQQPPLHQTVKHTPSPTKLQTWTEKLTRVGAFLAIVVGVLVAVRVASVLGTVVIVGGLAFVLYKFFIEDRARK
jgi:Protein of unknown function (DUF3040)